jgi:hypothetical protein
LPGSVWAKLITPGHNMLCHGMPFFKKPEARKAGINQAKGPSDRSEKAENDAGSKKLNHAACAGSGDYTDAVF